MIDPEQEIRGIEARRYDARRDVRPFVANPVETRVDRRDVGGRDGNDGGVVQTRLLEVREEEGAVASERPAEGSAVLRLCEGVFRRRERVARVEPLVAKESVYASSVVVRARLRDDVDDAARGPPELGDAARSYALELANHFLTVERAGEVCRVVVRREPVNDEPVVDESLPRDGEPGARDGGRFGKALVGDRVRARDAGRERREVEVVAPVQGQRVNLLRRDGLGHLRARSLDDGRIRVAHLYALRDAGHR